MANQVKDDDARALPADEQVRGIATGDEEFESEDTADDEDELDEDEESTF